MTAVKGQRKKIDTSRLTPALLIALFQKPQDRHFIIELENDFLGFIESTSTTYQLKPMNSYYRLLTHQLAEYHGLLHTVAKERDKCVIVYKEDGFQESPSWGHNGYNEEFGSLVLLQDLEPSIMYHFPPQYFTMAAMAAMNNILSSAATKAKYQHQNPSQYTDGMYNTVHNSRVSRTGRGKQVNSPFWNDKGLQEESSDISRRSTSVVGRGLSTITSTSSSAIELLQDSTSSSVSQEDRVDKDPDRSRSTSQEFEKYKLREGSHETSPQPHEFETSRYKFVKPSSKSRASGVLHPVLTDKNKETADNTAPLIKGRPSNNKGRKRSKAPNNYSSYENRKNKATQNSNGQSLQPTGNVIPFQKSRPPKYPQGYYYHSGQQIITYAAVPSPMMDYSYVQASALNAFGLQNCYPGYPVQPNHPVQPISALANSGNNHAIHYYSNGINYSSKGNGKASLSAEGAEYFSDRKLNTAAFVSEKSGKYGQIVVKDSKK